MATSTSSASAARYVSRSPSYTRSLTDDTTETYAEGRFPFAPNVFVERIVHVPLKRSIWSAVLRSGGTGVTARRGRGEGSIQQRKDGSWAAVVDLGWTNGKRTRKTVYGPTRKDVAHQLTDLLKTRKDGLPIPVGTENVDAFLARWLDATNRPYGRGHGSATNSTFDFTRCQCSAVSGYRIWDRITCRRSTRSDSRRVSRRRRSCICIACCTGHFRRPFDGDWSLATSPSSLTRRVLRKEMRALSPDEARRLLHAAQGNRFEALYTIAVTTGMREGELLGLRWRDVDLDGRKLHVVGSLQNIPGEGWTIVEPKTARSRRVVVLGEVGTERARRHRANQAEHRLRAGDEWIDNDLVFPNRFGKPMLPANLLIRSFHPLLAKANLPRVRFHDLRHMAASLLLDQRSIPRSSPRCSVIPPSGSHSICTRMSRRACSTRPRTPWTRFWP